MESHAQGHQEPPHDGLPMEHPARACRASVLRSHFLVVGGGVCGMWKIFIVALGMGVHVVGRLGSEQAVVRLVGAHIGEGGKGADLQYNM